MRKLAIKSFHFKKSTTPSLKMTGFSVLGIAVMFAMLLTPRVNAQEEDKDLDAPYVSTPPAVVDKMLDMANVGPGDYVIDPGCGDGRLVIEAARRGAVGHGVDIDPERIKEARKNARKAGVADRVMFVQEDIFETDFSKANVVTMYLLSSLNRRLRPILLKQLDPGSRIVCHDFYMGKWKPDKSVSISESGEKPESVLNLKDTGNKLENPLKLDNSDNKLLNLISSDDMFLDGHDVYYWVVPAEIEGQWQWKLNDKKFSMSVEQNFQKINLDVTLGLISLIIKSKDLVGDRLSFTAFDPENGVNYVFNGKIKGKYLTGKVQISGKNNKSIKNWTAKRK